MEHTLHRCLRTLARHAEWADAALYEACLQLDRATYHAAADGEESVHDLLNRLLVFLRVMQARLDGYEDGIAAHGGEQHKSFARVRDALLAEDVAVVERVRRIPEEELDLPVTYADETGKRHTSTHGDVVLEMLLGAAELRGAIGQKLRESGIRPKRTELTAFLRETA